MWNEKTAGEADGVSGSLLRNTGLVGSGFGLVEELKLDPRTKDIPVVVVSAKDISAEERKRLNGHIEALYQKGSLPTRKFVDQVIQAIEEKNGV